ncbi:MAG: class I SAM-dependent methyltransferase [Myxococcales bacterium]|nr:class I SAM-dependent methyltransferase [Myxococcales bacterium]
MTAKSDLTQRLYDLRFRLRLRERLRPAFGVLDAATLPATALSAAYLRLLRRFGIGELSRNRDLLKRIGIYPIQAHYYEPLVRAEDLRQPLNRPRALPGLDLNTAGQLKVLETFTFGTELLRIPVEQTSPTQFGYSNGTFAFGDAAFYYSMIRARKPRRVIEIGAGNSTLVAQLAIRANRENGATTEHVCIEPYEMPWLEKLSVTVERTRVEDVGLGFFEALAPGDFLFIDSSHVIRPQGDVLFLYQQVLPRLRPGVVIHVHDVFTPRDYPEHWVLKQMLLWDEQYLLESFLTFNTKFRVLAALNHLFCDHFEALATALPILREHRARAPMSFWMERTE